MSCTQNLEFYIHWQVELDGLKLHGTAVEPNSGTTTGWSQLLVRWVCQPSSCFANSTLSFAVPCRMSCTPSAVQIMLELVSLRGSPPTAASPSLLTTIFVQPRANALVFIPRGSHVQNIGSVVPESIGVKSSCIAALCCWTRPAPSAFDYIFISCGFILRWLSESLWWNQNFLCTCVRFLKGRVDLSQTRNSIWKGWGLVDACAEPVFAYLPWQSSWRWVDLWWCHQCVLDGSFVCTSLERTSYWQINPRHHAPYVRTFRLHYMSMPLTCMSLLALEKPRTLVGCQHSVGDDHRGFSLYMPATAYDCQEGSNLRGWFGLLREHHLHV